MTYKRSLIFTAVFTLVGTMALSTSAYAHDDAMEHTHDTVTKTSTEQTAAVKERAEAQKQALKERFEAAKEARMNKLEDKRLATCEKRSDKINSIIQKGTEQSSKHLAVFQKIEDKVKKFYADKNLSAEGYDAAVANADAKEAAAIAAIDASTELKFDCENADGAKPGDAVKELMKTRHAALKEYRTAVKDLILVVKKANGTQQSTEDGQEQ